MPQYTTKYVFEFDVQGDEAIRKARALRNELEQIVNNVNQAAGSQAQQASQNQPAQAATSTTAAVTQQVKAQVAETKSAMDDFAEVMQDLEVRYFGLRRLSYGLQSTGRDLTQAGLQTIRSMMDVAGSYLEFNEQMTRAAMAMELPIELEGKLQEATMELSETAGTFSAKEIMNGLRVWSQGTGIAVKDTTTLNDTLATTVEISRLAAVNDVALGEAVDYVGSIMNQFGATTSGVNKIIETLNFQAAKSFATITGLGESFKFIGPLANQLGDDYTELAVVFGDLANAGIDSSMAGRAMRQVYLQMLRPSKQVESTMNDLLRVNEAVGQSWQDIVFPGGQWMGLFDYLDLMASATEGMTDAEKEQKLAVVGTANALPSLLRMIDMTTTARKEGFSYYRAAWKEQQGIFDEEVAAYAKLKAEITGVPYTIQNAATLWQQITERWLNSDSARANNLQNRWDNAITRIGAVVFQEGVPYVEKFASALDGLAAKLEKDPSLAAWVINLSAVELGFGLATTAAGKMLQAATNITVLIQAIPSLIKVMADAWSRIGFLAPVIELALFAMALNAIRNQILEWGSERLNNQGFTREDLAEQLYAVDKAMGTFNGTLEEYKARLAATSPLYNSLASGADNAAKSIANMSAEQVAATKLLEEFSRAEELSIQRRREILGKSAPAAAPGIRPSMGAPAPAPIWGDIRDKYQGLIDAYVNYMDQIEAADQQFQISQQRSESEYQTELIAFDTDRLKARADLYTQYYKTIDDTARSYNRQLFLAERDHQQSLTDIVSEGVIERQKLVLSQAEAKAEAEASYQLSVADAYEQFAYDQTQSEEEYLYRRQQTIEDYNKQEAQAGEGQVDKQQETTDRLAKLYRDYLKEIERAREDHVRNLWDLVAARDARGMLDEIADFNIDMRRRKEDYEDDVADTKASAKKETKVRKDSLEEQLADLAEAEERRKAQAQEGFDRQLFLLKRAQDRTMVTLREQQQEELDALQQRIDDSIAAENEGYRRRLVTMAEEHGYRMKELERQHNDELVSFDQQSVDLRTAMQDRHDKQVALAKKYHEEDMIRLTEQAKAKLQTELDALTLPESELQKIFLDRWKSLEKFLGKEITDIGAFYKTNLLTVMKTAWADADRQSSEWYLGSGFGTGTTSVGSTSSSKASTGGTAGASSGASATVAGGKPTSGGQGVAGGGTPVPAGFTTWDMATAGQGVAGAGANFNTGVPATGYAGGTQIVPYQKWIQEAAAGAGLSWTELAAQLAWESGFNPKATGAAGELGMGQWMPGTWAWRGGGGDPLDPKTAIFATANYMKLLKSQASAQGKSPAWEFALGGYNAGEGALSKAKTLTGFPRITWEQYIPNIQAYRNQFANGTAWGKNWYTGRGLGRGGFAGQRGLYELAEIEPEWVIPSGKMTAAARSAAAGALSGHGKNWSSFSELLAAMFPSSAPIPANMGRGGGGGGAGGGTTIVVEQKGWVFQGSMSARDRDWFRRASKESAYEAISEVFK